MDKLHLTTILTEGVLLCNVKVWENCVNLANSIFLFFKHFNECLGIITTQIIEQSRNIETNNINSRYRFLNFTAHTIIILLYRSTKINQIDLEIIWVNSTISIYDCYIDTDIRKNIAALKANIHCLLESKSPSLLPRERERLTIFFLRFYLLLEREEGREKKRERNMDVWDVWEIHWLVASHNPPVGDLAHNPGMCCDQELNQWLFGLQASTQSTEPQQPGQKKLTINRCHLQRHSWWNSMLNEDHG